MQWNDYEPIEIERCLDCGYELELCDPFDVMTLEDMGINSAADLEMYAPAGLDRSSHACSAWLIFICPVNFIRCTSGP